MRDTGRIILTGMIWVVLASIGMVGLDNGTNFGAVALVALLLAFGTGVTNILLGRGTQTDQPAAADTTKAKRTSKTDLLLELMDDDEREAFKAALKQRLLDGPSRLNDVPPDGEVDVESLQALMKSQRDRR